MIAYHHGFTELPFRAHLLRPPISWWRGEDSNLRRLSQQIYSLPPLTAREPLRKAQYWTSRSLGIWSINPGFSDSGPDSLLIRFPLRFANIRAGARF